MYELYVQMILHVLLNGDFTIKNCLLGFKPTAFFFLSINYLTLIGSHKPVLRSLAEVTKANSVVIGKTLHIQYIQ